MAHPTDWAIGTVFAGVPDWIYAEPAYNDDIGILTIEDLEGLLADLDLDPEVVEHPYAFTDGDALVVPWPVTERIVRRLAERNAAVLLPALDKEEREAEQHNRWGYYARDTYIPAETCAQTDTEFQAARELVRAWCGEAARDRHDELVALRAEVVRLGHLVESAVEALQTAGARSSAERIERELGVPIDVVRAHREQQD